ncbi:MAG: C4-type zinc ribbon domain-containing protein [bacterium]
MSTQAERLAAVQDVDLRIIKLQKEIQDIPARRKVIDATCEHKKKDFNAAKTAMTSKQAEAKQVELEIETVNQKIRKFREQQLQLKSNKEFKAMEDEIRAAEKEIKQIEERQLAKMEEIEAAARVMSSARGIVDKAESEKQAELAALDTRNADISAQLQKYQAERAAKVADVDARWLQKYEPLMRGKKNAVLAKVEHGVCGGCNMAVAPHVVHDARRGDIMVSCSHCGRMLY